MALGHQVFATVSIPFHLMCVHVQGAEVKLQNGHNCNVMSNVKFIYVVVTTVCTVFSLLEALSPIEALGLP
jgi:hypothetical protein